MQRQLRLMHVPQPQDAAFAGMTIAKGKLHLIPERIRLKA